MLYHNQVFWPKRIKRQLPNGIVRLVHTRHAMQAAQTDRYGAVKLPDRLDLSAAQIVEAETTIAGDMLVKVVARMPLDDTRDICYALFLEDKSFCVVGTVWVNLRQDNHRTLDKSRYVRK